MGELFIKIKEDSPTADITFIGKEGVSKQKSISIEDLVSNLVSDHKISTNLIPFGTRYFKGSNVSYSIIIETQAKVRNMSILRYNSSGDKKINEIIPIPFPVCLFYFPVINNKCDPQAVKIFSLKYPIQSNDDTFCHFPFSNVYNDGRVCWGGVSVPKISNPMELVGVINSFLGSQFNGDLAGNNFVAQGAVVDFWSLLKHLKDKEEFPASILRSNGILFKNFVAKI